MSEVRMPQVGEFGSPANLQTLRYGKLVLLVGLGDFLLFSTFLALANLYPNGTGGLWVNAEFAAFAGLGLFLVAVYLLDRPVVVSDEGIVQKGLLARPRHLRWEAVTELKYDPAMGWFVLRTGSARPIRISILRKGLPYFARMATLHVGNSAMPSQCREMLELIGQGQTPSVERR